MVSYRDIEMTFTMRLRASILAYDYVKKEIPMKITIKPKQHYQAKMSPEELQAHIQMARTGASRTKNGKAYRRHDKHKRGNKHDY